MTEPVPPRLARSSSRSRRRSRSAWANLGRFLSEWWAEILTGLLVGLGIFLLFERMQIRQALLGWLQKGWSALLALFDAAQGGLMSFVKSRTVSDLVGLLLLGAALGIVAWRVRWRLLRTPRFTDRVCPSCGSALHRVHRRSLDRAISLIVPVRRYRCDNRECRWNGLRFGRGH